MPVSLDTSTSALVALQRAQSAEVSVRINDTSHVRQQVDFALE